MNNEFLLQDRIQKIKQIITQYGQDNFYVSFSGGKDSTVLSALIDMAIPNNRIPRVFANTGIEYNKIVDFVKKKQTENNTWELIILKPEMPIKQTLEKYGYPFKSKVHSHCVMLYQRDPEQKMWQGYTGKRPDYWHGNTCPKKLEYQFTNENTLKISDMCCVKMKEEPLIKWAKNNNKSIAIVGIMPDEGGRRMRSSCLQFKGKKLFKFQPLVVLNKEWEEWLINEYNIDICELYKEPYNFERTGCKGCPFTIPLQLQLDTIEKYFPNERKQCEYIWEPVYKEYRKIGYRLKGENKWQIKS